jgi:hypothetical protein
MEPTNKILKLLASDLRTDYELTKASAFEANLKVVELEKRHKGEMIQDVLDGKMKVLRYDLTEESREVYDHGAALVKEAADNADQFTRGAFLDRSNVLPEYRAPVGIDVSAKAIISAIRASHEETLRGNLARELSSVSDRKLAEYWLPKLEREQNPGLAGLMLHEGQKRGGVLGSKIRIAAEKIPLPEFDEAQELLSAIHDIGLELNSEFHHLKTGELDVHAQAVRAAANYCASQEKPKSEA